VSVEFTTICLDRDQYRLPMKVRIECFSKSEKSVNVYQHTVSMEIRSGCLWRLKTRGKGLSMFQLRLL